ncbi:hypothetical protein C8046_15005 [Serinibacter arcticus]|uniref:DUF3618 domain-containing protein n=1 Tax=Serinibacter arcticus TaxID=1655435 RepID=A0A2U1ZXU4_9MICO|nr:DUF3618 domain-containing protein [Serinibacter arcticus]PWD51760.1 hypothetical protein C8046_15005 [Serinibacter arcticus]
MSETPRPSTDAVVHDAGYEPPAGPTIPVEESEDSPRKRSVAEIQADNERRRAELGRTVDELADRVDPRAHVEAAKQRATDVAGEVTEVAKVKAGEVQEVAAAFVDDVKKREPRALAIVGGAVAALAAIIAISARKK